MTNEQIVVLDYTTCNVWVYNLPSKHMQYDEVEEWLSKDMKLDTSNCSWMAGTITINHEPVN